jgi:alkylhydroperoxidase family enzyme
LNLEKRSWDKQNQCFSTNCTTHCIHERTDRDRFFERFSCCGYTKENLVDLIMAIGIITVTNLLHNVTEVPIDFPLAAEL